MSKLVAWQYQHEVITSFDPTLIWKIIIDVENWHLWDKDVKSASLSGPFAIGTKGNLVSKEGASADFYITSVHPENNYCNYYIVGWLTKLHFKHTVIRCGEKTKIIFSYRFSGLFRHYYRYKMQKQIKKIMHDAMSNLQQYACLFSC